MVTSFMSLHQMPWLPRAGSIVQDFLKDGNQSASVGCLQEFGPLGILSLPVALPGLALLSERTIPGQGCQRGRLGDSSRSDTRAAMGRARLSWASTRETSAGWRGSAGDKTSNCA